MIDKTKYLNAAKEWIDIAMPYASMVYKEWREPYNLNTTKLVDNNSLPPTTPPRHFTA